VNEEQFNVLVGRLEAYERQHPRAYTFRLAMLAVLGYLYLFVVVTFLIGLVVVIGYIGRLNFLVIKFLLIPLGIVGVVLRSLWIQLPEPDGEAISAADAPRLFDLIDEIKNAVRAPKFSRVLISDEFNAGVYRVSKFGAFGWSNEYLVLGLPLMHAVSPMEFKAILAHEFGHLSSRHGHFGSWIYRVRKTWLQIMDVMNQEKRYGSELFRAFFNWYAPFFSAYSFVLAHRHEYEADEFAVELVGRQQAAQALIKVELRQRQMDDEFWPTLYAGAKDEPEPPREPLSQMFAALRRPLARDESIAWLSSSLNLQTQSADSHPSLADRLSAMGYSQNLKRDDASFTDFFKSNGEDAAQVYLQSIPEDYLIRRNRWWRKAIAKPWRERHGIIQEARQNLAGLATKAQTESLTEDERFEVARLKSETEGSSTALPILRDLLSTNPNHVGATFLLGQILLEDGDKNGIELIEKAVVNDPIAVITGCQLIEAFFRRTGEHQQASQYSLRAREQYKKLQKAQHERATIYQGDEFQHHNLERNVVEDLRSQLSKFAQVRHALLVRKSLHYFPEEPFYVLGIIPERPWYKGRYAAAEHGLVRLLVENLELPGQTLIVILEGSRRELRSVFRMIPGSAII
jgi:Zn-dependent protease with chaperone function